MLKNTAKSHEKSNYRPEIDGLRAFAILPVIINHFNKEWLPSGYLGVDIFFVISGLVITSSLLHKPSQGFRENLLSFYSRRIKRLLPALWAMVILGAIFISFFNPSPGLSLQTGIAALFGVSNLYLLYQATDYFAPASELNIFTHTWSLGVEEQFYLLFPLLLWLSGIWRTGVGLTKRTQNVLGILLIGLSSLSLALFVCLYPSQQAMAYFLMPSRFWEMGLGCLLALQSWKKGPVRPGGHRLVRTFIPWLILVLLAVIFREAPEDQGRMATITVVFLSSLLITTLQPPGPGDGQVRRSADQFLSHPLLISIGILSYSLYLWHWPVFCLSRWTMGTPLWSLPVLLAVMMALALASFHWIEEPLRQARWSRSRGLVISKGVAFSLLSSLFLVVLGGPLKGKLFTGRGGQEWDTARFSSARLDQESALTQRVSLMLRHCNLTPFMLGKNSYKSDRKIDVQFARDCFRSMALSSDGRAGNRPNVFLVGDSFAEKLAPFAALAARNNGYGFHLLYGYGCPYLLRSPRIRNPSFPACRYFDEPSLEQALLDSLRKDDVVILRLHATSKSYLRYPNMSTQPSPEAYDQAIEDLRQKIRARQAHLILIGGNPNLSTQDLAALRPDWFNAWNRTAEIDPRNSQETRFYHALDDHLLQKYGSGKEAIYFSLKPILCDDRNRCHLSVDDKFLYEDDHHLSPYGHEVFLPQLEQRLKRLSSASASLSS
jgi:peptidoglycan/LPS O-acetylase OafA/YrhL